MAMDHHEYDQLKALTAEAIGVPGQRRFRVVGGVEGDVVVLWMEKEELRALGLAIEELLEQLGMAGLATQRLAAEALLPAVAGPTSPEYAVGRMAIGYDEERKLIALFAHDIEQEEEEDELPIFAGRMTPANAKALAEQIVEVVNAGRPRCPRCGALIGPEGHVCPHDNGHLKVKLQGS